jgi:hypothetical protein
MAAEGGSSLSRSLLMKFYLYFLGIQPERQFGETNEEYELRAGQAERMCNRQKSFLASLAALGFCLLAFDVLTMKLIAGAEPQGLLLTPFWAPILGVTALLVFLRQFLRARLGP